MGIRGPAGALSKIKKSRVTDHLPNRQKHHITLAKPFMMMVFFRGGGDAGSIFTTVFLRCVFFLLVLLFLIIYKNCVFTVRGLDGGLFQFC